MNFKLGTQLYGLGKELDTDFSETIRQLHAIGFECVEPMCVLTSNQMLLPKNMFSYALLEKLCGELEKYQMSIPSVHVGVGMGRFIKPAGSIIKHLKKLHTSCGVRNFVFSGMFTDEYGAKKWGKLLREIAAKTRSLNFNIIYHNHDVEHIKSNNGDGEYSLLDCFFQYAGDDILLQLDIGWAAYGDDERKVFEKYADRIIEIHCKDFSEEILHSGLKRDDIPPEGFVSIGSGAVQTRAILCGLDALPRFNGTVLIDQDKSGNSMMDDLQRGYQYLDEIRKI